MVESAPRRLNASGALVTGTVYSDPSPPSLRQPPHAHGKRRGDPADTPERWGPIGPPSAPVHAGEGDRAAIPSAPSDSPAPSSWSPPGPPVIPSAGTTGNEELRRHPREVGIAVSAVVLRRSALDRSTTQQNSEDLCPPKKSSPRVFGWGCPSASPPLL